MSNPTSFVTYTANGTDTKFNLSGIDGWLNDGFIKVYLDGVLQTTGYQLIVESGVNKVEFTVIPPAAGTVILLRRETPNTIANFKDQIVDFDDGSVLTAAALDRAIEGLVHISQESEDAAGDTISLTDDRTRWDAQSKRLSNMADGLDSSDAVSMAQFTTATLFGGSVTVPQVWNITGTGVTTYTLSNPAPLNTSSEMFIVEFGGAIQDPATYTITSNSIIFDSAKTGAISVRNFGVARNLIASTAIIDDASVTTTKLADGAVTEPKLANSAVTNAKIATGAVSLNRIASQSVYRLLGTSGVDDGSGRSPVITIPYSDYTRQLLDDTSATQARTTLGLGTLATKNVVGTAELSVQAVTADRVSDGAIGTTQLAVTSVTESRIADSAVVSGKLASDAVTTAKILDAAVTEPKLDPSLLAYLTKWNPEENPTTPEVVSSGTVQVELKVNLLPLRTLSWIDYSQDGFQQNSGSNYFRLRNNGSTTVKLIVLFSRTDWNVAGIAQISNPDDYYLWPSGNNPDPTIVTLAAESSFYFRNWQGGQGWGGGSPPSDTATGVAGSEVLWQMFAIRMT
jgi:hypothetical protein